MRLFQFACKEGESLVYFDHVLDVVGRSYCLAADLISETVNFHGSTCLYMNIKSTKN